MSTEYNDAPVSGKRPYDVGRGKPPVHTRFQKGSAGNRKGRLKVAALDLSEAFEKVSAEKYHVRVDGKPASMSALESAVARQVDDALKGNTRAARALLERAHKHGFFAKRRYKSFIDATRLLGEFGDLMGVYHSRARRALSAVGAARE